MIERYEGPKKPLPPATDNHFGLPYDAVSQTRDDINKALNADIQWLTKNETAGDDDDPPAEWSGSFLYTIHRRIHEIAWSEICTHCGGPTTLQSGYSDQVVRPSKMEGYIDQNRSHAYLDVIPWRHWNPDEGFRVRGNIECGLQRT